jgi:uncharacterized protein (UPF0128 family)
MTNRATMVEAIRSYLSRQGYDIRNGRVQGKLELYSSRKFDGLKFLFGGRKYKIAEVIVHDSKKDNHWDIEAIRGCDKIEKAIGLVEEVAGFYERDVRFKDPRENPIRRVRRNFG